MQLVEPATLSVQKAADRAGVSRHTIKEAIRLGQLQAVKLGRRKRVLANSLEALLEGNNNGSEQTAA